MQLQAFILFQQTYSVSSSGLWLALNMNRNDIMCLSHSLVWTCINCVSELSVWAAGHWERTVSLICIWTSRRFKKLSHSTCQSNKHSFSTLNYSNTLNILPANIKHSNNSSFENKHSVDPLIEKIWDKRKKYIFIVLRSSQETFPSLAKALKYSFSFQLILFPLKNG